MTHDKDALLREVKEKVKHAGFCVRNFGARKKCDCGLGVLLERITAALAEKDDGWIKCSERLPSHGERVQIVCEDDDGDPYRTIATYNDNDYGPFIRDGGRKAKNPTHWRPLPPLPKGDEQ